MKINAGEIRVGMLLEHKNDLWQVLKTQHVKPGKGGAFAQVEMKSINKNTKLNERFRSSETVEKASLEETKYNYLYEDEKNYFFIEPKSFEQIEIKKDIIGEKGKLLTENLEVNLSFYNDNPITINLPNQSIKLSVNLIRKKPIKKFVTRNLSESIERSVEDVVDSGIDVSELISAIEKEPTVRAESSYSQETLDELVEQVNKGRSIPGQSLTNPVEQKYPWEQPPQMTSLKQAREKIFLDLLEPNRLRSVIELMSTGIPVNTIAQVVLREGFNKGKFNEISELYSKLKSEYQDKFYLEIFPLLLLLVLQHNAYSIYDRGWLFLYLPYYYL